MYNNHSFWGSVFNSSKEIDRLREDTVHLQSTVGDAYRVLDQIETVQYDVVSQIQQADEKIRKIQSDIGEASGRRHMIKRQIKLPALKNDVQDVRTRLLDSIAIAQLYALSIWLSESPINAYIGWRRNTISREETLSTPSSTQQSHGLERISRL